MKLDLHCEAYYLRSFLTKTESEALYQNLINNKELIQPFALELSNGECYEESNGKFMFVDKNLAVQGRFPAAIWGSNAEWS
jgi:hypothetical protein